MSANFSTGNDLLYETTVNKCQPIFIKKLLSNLGCTPCYLAVSPSYSKT